jgi:uncharacterized Tic20 family protein
MKSLTAKILSVTVICLIVFSCKKNDNAIVDQQPADKINEQFTVNLTILFVSRNRNHPNVYLMNYALNSGWNKHK